MNARRRPLLLTLLTLVLVLVGTERDARAAGSFKVKNTEVQESSGAWHVYVTIELPKAPLTAHQAMRFVFVQTSEFERTLTDGRPDPVLNRVTVNSGKSKIETMDVDFSDPRGTIYKGTKFDFSLARTSGYMAGEWKMQIRSADGIDIGGTTLLTLRGDNEVVDRRAMVFNAGNVRKIQGQDGGTKNGGTEEPSNNVGMGDVTPIGTGKPVVGPEAYQKTPEEEIKVKPSGCGCDVTRSESTSMGLFASVAVAITLSRLAERRTNRRRL